MKRKNFFIVPNQIFELGLKPKEFIVYCCLLRHSDKNTDNALFRRLYEDNVLGKVTNEQFRMLSDGYNTEQREIAERLPIVKQEIEDLKAAATNVERFVDITNKYTDLRELTPEVLRTFIEQIIIHERTAKHSKTATQQIDIYFRYIGKLAPEQVA